jgi:hypothetical protein
MSLGDLVFTLDSLPSVLKALSFNKIVEVDRVQGFNFAEVSIY